MTIELSLADLQSILEFTVSLAREAGKVILQGAEAIQLAGSNVDEKKNSVDLVTEFDVKVEELVKKKIGERYPHFEFIGEESYASGSRAPMTDVPTFCIDPIDGTTNFVHGFPWACISLGLIYKRSPVMGVIYNPFIDYMYSGVKGQGSFLSRNGGPQLKLPLSKSPKPLESLNHALLGVEWGSDRKSSIVTSKSQSYLRLSGDPDNGVAGGKMAHSLRSLGSAALNCAMVAQGGLDMYWEIGCWAWDVCAGIVIIQEAGGIVSGSHEVFSQTKDTEAFGNVGETILTGRKYLFIRAIGDTKEETGADAQKRIMTDFYATVEDVDAS